VGGHLETSRPAPATGQAMKKDLLWTPKNELGQKTQDYDKEQRTNTTDAKRELEQNKQEGQTKIKNDNTHSYNGKKMTYKDDNDIRQITNNYVKIRTTKNYDLRHETKTEQQDNDDRKVQKTTDLRHLLLLKKKIYTNSKVTSRDRCIRVKSDSRAQETLNYNSDAEETDKNSKTDKSRQITTKTHRKMCPKTKKISKISIPNSYLTKSEKKLIINFFNIGKEIKLFLTLLILIPAVNSYTLRGTTKLMTKLETVNIQKVMIENDVEDIDNDPLTHVGLNTTGTTACVCPTTSQPTWENSTTTQSTSTGTTTFSGLCLCPGDGQIMAEEETATNMPVMNGKRRRRKEIEEMDLFVDEFDQKILKKMPFLKSY